MVNEARSRTMRAVKSRDTKPELTVRRLIHNMGFRFRLHRKDLPGSPDIVFPSRKKVIFVHGCFWHGHDCKRGARQPQTNNYYWSTKISRNRERDKDVIARLKDQGWEPYIVWECQLREHDLVLTQLLLFLSA